MARAQRADGRDQLGLLVLAFFGICLFGLSFASWIDFPGSIRPALRGTDVELIFGGGDGYLTAGIGLAISVAALAMLYSLKSSFRVLVLIGGASIGAFTIAANAVIARWQTNRDYSDLIYPVDGAPTIELVLLAGLGVAATVTAMLLLFREHRAGYPFSGDDQAEPIGHGELAP